MRWIWGQGGILDASQLLAWRLVGETDMDSGIG